MQQMNPVAVTGTTATPRSLDSVILTAKTTQAKKERCNTSSTAESHEKSVWSAPTVAATDGDDGNSASKKSTCDTSVNLMQAALRGEWSVVDQVLRHSNRQTVQAIFTDADQVGAAAATAHCLSHRSVTIFELVSWFDK